MRIIEKIFNKLGYYKRGKKENIVQHSYDYIVEPKHNDDNIYCASMSKIETARYKQFLKDHKNCRINTDGTHKFGAIGGGTRVSFIGTGLGNIVQCTCEACGVIEDITDTNSW